MRVLQARGGGSKDTGCNLSRAHTHPYFEIPRDENLWCNGDPIGHDQDRVDDLNAGGMEFSDQDKRSARSEGVEAHLGVSDRSAVKAYRRYGRIETI